MREWRELHRQLLVMGEERGESGEGSEPSADKDALVAFPPADRAGTAASQASPLSPLPSTDSYEAIHRCLLSGWPTQVGLKDERSQYRGTRERKFQIFPGSALAKAAPGRSPSAPKAVDGREGPSEAREGREKPQWVLAGQIIDLQKVYGMLCARIEPEWIEQQAAHLVKRAWRDAHWSRKRGAVLAFEQVTLFGLTLVEKRSVQFGTQDPALAHEIFVREALARCEIDARRLHARQPARARAAHELEAKRRRSGWSG
jgi:ATP-dependent helicase HrpA